MKAFRHSDFRKGQKLYCMIIDQNRITERKRRCVVEFIGHLSDDFIPYRIRIRILSAPPDMVLDQSWFVRGMNVPVDRICGTVCIWENIHEILT